MRRWSLALCLPVLAGCYSQERPTTPPPADAPAELVALTGAVVMIGAGDIAVCGVRGDEATGSIVDSVVRADSAAKVENVVFTIGDNAYSTGSETDFMRCFTPSWGRTTIMKWIRPAPGNHDYATPGAAPYYKYFDGKAGPPGRGYYSYDLGEWHVISLNSEILIDPRSRPEANEQEEWLRKDLKDHDKKCTLAYFHRPLFSSGVHGPAPEMLSLWNILYAADVDLILNGHDHDYERFRPQTPLGAVDSLKGIEEIIVGTGGGVLRPVRYPLARNSVVQIHGYYGVIKLTLGGGEYRRAFLDTRGRIWDRGGRKCH